MIQITQYLICWVVAVLLDKVDPEDLPEVLPVATQRHEAVEVLREQAVRLDRLLINITERA